MITRLERGSLTPPELHKLSAAYWSLSAVERMEASLRRTAALESKRNACPRSSARREMPLARKIFQLAVLALISHGLPATAQEENTGVLRGVVEDPSRTPVDGARVRLENKSIQKKFDATTDEKGEFI